ncbi:MAG: arsenic efflux protein [Lachnospiraceae bacterium]|nr:arsenic efflux protein [Lachnospiraceae bacterium]
MHLLEHALIHTIKDSIKILPFLFITYLIMEYIEHRMKEKTKKIVKNSGKFGPLLGGVLGVFPQCGFSAAAANLYAGRVITLGTLMAIFLSTSDEMLPILISEQVAPIVIAKIVGMKLLIGIVAGFVIDFFVRGHHHHEHEDEMHIHSVCDHDHCHCEEGIFKSACVHTLQIFAFIAIISFALNFGVELIGEETLASFILNQPIIGPILSGVVGLIPNCASSVVITELYLEGMMSMGTMLAGLLVNSGVGILVLFKENIDMKENAKILALLYAIGILAGIIIECIGFQI